MKIIRKSDKMVAKLSSYDDTARCKESMFNVRFCVNGEQYIVNTLSRAIMQSESEEKLLNTSFSRADLLQNGFLVPETVDEEKNYLQVYNILKLLRPFKKGKKLFKILTTTNCNARCFYCFEEGIQKENMSLETAEEVVNYILTNRCDDKITLYWFGGEPLCNTKVIDYICTRLTDENVSFESTIVSNGYFVDETLMKKISEKWHTTFMQVTLDGMGETHNLRKAYVHPVSDPFERTIKAIRLLLENQIKVLVRLNFDENNYESIEELISFLQKEFVPSKYISVQPVILLTDCLNCKGSRDAEADRFLQVKYREFNEKLENMGFIKYGSLSPVCRKNKCMADNPNSVVINTNGDLYTCQNCGDNMEYGNITDDFSAYNQEVLNSWRNPSVIPEKCHNCPFIPECTAVSLCPVQDSFCVDSKKRIMGKRLSVTLEEIKKEIENEI